MSDSSAIQWTNSTWNVVTGCTRVSPGCARCYIERTPPFRMEGRVFARVGNEETTGVRLHPDRLEQPMRWRKPRRVFVCSLADLFHEEVADEYIAQVFQAMRSVSRHTFQVLTKRPERAREWFERCGDWEGWITHDGTPPTAYGGTGVVVGDRDCWPLPNVWLGVSIENARYTWRADVLRAIPAAVRFISAEPLLGSVYPKQRGIHYETQPLDRDLRPREPRGNLDLIGIDWVIIGGESGPGARGMDLEWVREIIEAARGATVCRHGLDLTEACYCSLCEAEGHEHERPAVFVKQLGSVWAKRHSARGLDCGPADAKGGDWEHWPPWLRIREFPGTPADGTAEAVLSTARAEAS